MILKEFQINAVEKLILRSRELLEQKGQKKIIFKSPTGSGKTIVMAEYLNRIIKDNFSKKPLSFIWTTPRKTLSIQSKNKLDLFFKKEKIIKCTFFEELSENHIPENEILFLNWEAINKVKSNTIIIENEKEFYLSKIIDKTYDEGRDIILIIDESHHHATSEISKKLIKDINPKLTVEVSATPTINDPDEIVQVSLEDVKREGMIKKSVILNDKFKNYLENNKIKTSLAKGNEKFILDQALKKRNQLLKNYKLSKSKVNPLILIQLPDKKTNQEERIKNEIIKYLKEKYKITTENGKLGIYLSENKRNLENISKNDDEVEVLIFKQAIALGWDCPRAQILLLFRDWKSLTFSIQTVGRIMRLPEIKKGHYTFENLNHSYIYTNLDYIELKEDQARDYLTIYTSNSNKKIKLESYSRIRQREKTRLNPLFIKIFLEESQKYKLHKKLTTKNVKANFSLIVKGDAESTDSLKGRIFKGKKFEVVNDNDLQNLFDDFIRQNLNPFFPEDRSVGKLKEALYNFFRKYMNLDYEKSFKDILNIVLSEKNSQSIIEVIDISKERYQLESQRRKEELQKNLNWSFPTNITFAGSYSELKSKKSVMKPFYYDFKWKTEENFIKFLEKSKMVDYWFKNGDSDQTFFAIPYDEQNQTKLFYVDFIVKFKNSKIGLFDTKSGSTIDLAKAKSDGLQNYIIKHKKKNIFGGIVTNTDSYNFKGRWVMFNKNSKFLNKNKFNNWETLFV